MGLGGPTKSQKLTQFDEHLQTEALLKRGLLATDSPHGKLRFGVPQHALRFYFPRLWPEAEAGAGPEDGR